MTRSNLLGMFGAALALVLSARDCIATPFSQAEGATLGSAATLNPIEHVHGTHHACRLGPVSRWGGVVRLHQHVGPAHLPVRC